LGSADLNATFYGAKREEGADLSGAASGASKAGPRKHIMQVSTYQMVVLMLFNNRDKLSYEVKMILLFVSCWIMGISDLCNICLVISAICPGFVNVSIFTQLFYFRK